MAEDASTPSDDKDINDLSMDELRVKAARLLELYHAATDPDEMLDLSTKYTKVDMLIDSREASPDGEPSVDADENPFQLSPLDDVPDPEESDANGDEPEPPPLVEDESDSAPKPLADQEDAFSLPPMQEVVADEMVEEPMVEIKTETESSEPDESIEPEKPVELDPEPPEPAEPDTSISNLPPLGTIDGGDGEEGPISALPPLSAIDETSTDVNSKEEESTEEPSEKDTTSSPPTEDPEPDTTSDLDDALASLNAAISTPAVPGKPVDEEEALFDIEMDHSDPDAAKDTPIDIQMDEPESSAASDEILSSGFDDGTFDTPLADDELSPEPVDTSDTFPPVELTPGEELDNSDSAKWEKPAFGDTPDAMPPIPALTDSSIQEEAPKVKDLPSIPHSLSEEMPKLTLGEDKRICGRCGEATDIDTDRCQSCSYDDPSLGIVHSVTSGDTQQAAQLLKAKPAIVHTTTSTHGWTLLHMAASGGNMRLVKVLIEAGSQVNRQNVHGKSALHYAASKGHVPIIYLLLEHKADKTLKFEGKTPYDLALESGNKEAIAALKD